MVLNWSVITVIIILIKIIQDVNVEAVKKIPKAHLQYKVLLVCEIFLTTLTETSAISVLLILSTKNTIYKS